MTFPLQSRTPALLVTVTAGLILAGCTATGSTNTPSAAATVQGAPELNGDPVIDRAPRNDDFNRFLDQKIEQKEYRR